MTNGQIDPLSDWWAQCDQHESARVKWVQLFADRVFITAQNVLDQNKSEDRHPSTWNELAEIMGQHRSTIHRWGTLGNLTALKLFVFSCVLRVPVTDLLPEPHDWLHETIRAMCDGTVSSEEAHAHVSYILGKAPAASRNGELDLDEVRRVAESANCDDELVRTSVQKVVAALASRLTEKRTEDLS